MTIQFKKAVKVEAKARIALVGPSGSGKSWTSLVIASALAGPDGRIAAVDTEHKSLSKYADDFSFDAVEVDTYEIDVFLDALTAAEENKYSVFLCDSLSHFWMGKGGALDFVDSASKKYKDNMGGWKEFKPQERLMIDRMIASPCHIVATMRTKTDYQEVTGDNGKKKRVKIGLAPVQRDSLEYEFDYVGYMDDENTLITDKTRCQFYAGKALPKPTAKDFAPFIKWLNGAERAKVSESELTQWLNELTDAATLNDLKASFVAAFDAAKRIDDQGAIAAITAAKDKRKGELTQVAAA